VDKTYSENQYGAEYSIPNLAPERIELLPGSRHFKTGQPEVTLR
jgi:hypothetical protein